MRLIDMHCDTLWVMSREKSVKLKKNDSCIDIEKMKVAESIAQFFACFIYMDDYCGVDRWDQGYQLALDMIARGKREFAENAETIALASDYQTFRSNCEQGKISAFLTIEEGGILNGDMVRLKRLFDEGIRLVTLTWNYENCIGFPNSRNVKIMKKGLKPFGKEVVEQMNEIGILIDVSHLSDGGFGDVLKHSKRPVVASHSNARALCSHPRNLSDEMIKVLSDRGGVAGVNFYPYFLQENGKATVEDIANHVVHMYEKGGEDVVAIGTDFDGFDEGELDIAHIGEMNKVYDAVKRRGFSDRQMEKFWAQNAMRVMKDVII